LATKEEREGNLATTEEREGIAKTRITKEKENCKEPRH
jgi:hypothetical protein